MHYRLLAAFGLVSLLVACSHPLDPPPPNTDTLYEYRLESPDGKAIGLNELARSLQSSDVILVGEWHTHPGIHLFQAQLLRQMAHYYPRTVLSMEQFSRPAQPAINRYLAGETGERTLMRDGKSWPNYASDYRPLMEIARLHALPVIASNTTREIVRCLSSKGAMVLDDIPAPERQNVARTLDTSGSPYKEKFFSAMFHGDEKQTDKRYAAQLAWDATMAESISDHLAANPGAKVLHIAGRFHVEGGLGIASQILARNPGARVTIVTAITEDETLPEGSSDIRLVVAPLPKQWLSRDELNNAIGKMKHGSGAASCPY